MLNKIKDYLVKGLEQGFNYPKVKDDSAIPSSTLWFAYATFFIASYAVINLIVKGEILTAAITAISFWSIAMVFYKFKDIDKFKLDIKQGQVEVEDENEKNDN